MALGQELHSTLSSAGSEFTNSITSYNIFEGRKTFMKGDLESFLFLELFAFLLIPLSVISFELECSPFPFSSFHGPFYRRLRESLQNVIN